MQKTKSTKEFIPDNLDYSKIYSPSKLKMFDQCPKQYFFSYIDPIFSKMKNKLKTLPENIWKFQTVGKAVHNAITLFYYLPETERTQDNLFRQLHKTWESDV